MTGPEGMLQVVVPMAGDGRRFLDAGYTTPKPLLPIHGLAMFEVVLLNLLDPRVVSYTIVARQEWNLADRIADFSERLGVPIDLVEVAKTTRGPASTVMTTADLLVPSLPVVIANSDQFVNAPMAPFYTAVVGETCDGVILTMKDDDPKWSYAATDQNGHVTHVAEKEVISEDATVGIYGFATARLMRHSIIEMMDAGDTVNGEFYVAPAYNYLIQAGGIVLSQDLGPINSVMHGMGIPEDYENFLRSPVSQGFTNAERRPGKEHWGNV